MNGGVKTALLISGAALAGCSTSEPVKVRAIANPSAVLSRGDALAVARGQFLLGNVGLALEGFRKAQREDPYNAAVMSGIGDCYAAMGRYDIAESSYETALSLAPRDHRLLMGLASVLERGGDFKRAKDIREEAARFEQTAALMAAQAAARAKMLAAAEPPAQTKSSPGSVTVKLPRARAAKVATASKPRPKPEQPTVIPLKVAAAAPVLPLAPAPAPKVQQVAAVATPVVAPAPVRASATLAAPAPAARAVVAAAPIAAKPSAPIAPTPVAAPAAPLVPIRTASAPAVPLKPALMPAPIPAPVIEPPVPNLPAVAVAAAAPAKPAPVPVKAAVPVAPAAAPARILPAVLPVERRVSPGVTTEKPLVPSPQPSKAAPQVEVAFRAEEPAGPRLQRLTNGEVALLTTKDASWRAKATAPTVLREPAPVVEEPRRAAPLQTAAAGSVNWVPLKMSRASASVQVLNAARSNGLAGSARNVLFGRGWRSVAIGNAGKTRQTSVVFYPKERAKLGRSLAAQFGVRAKMAKTNAVILVLGRDSVGKIANKRLS